MLSSYLVQVYSTVFSEVLHGFLLIVPCVLITFSLSLKFDNFFFPDSELVEEDCSLGRDVIVTSQGLLLFLFHVASNRL